MNYDNELGITKEAICEYINNIIALSYPYMKNNNIPYDFSGMDNLSVSLKLLIDISNKIKHSNNGDEIIRLRSKILELEEGINNITNIGGIVNERK